MATAPSSAAIAEVLPGLGRNGTLLSIAAAIEPLGLVPASLIGKRAKIQGWPSGAPKDSEDTMNFCALTGVRAMIEEFPLTEAARAFERMMANQVRFRAVLVNTVA